MSDSLLPHGLYNPWNSAGQNTGVDSLSLLQGIFPNQGLNPGFPHCRWILYQLSRKGSPSKGLKKKKKSLLFLRRVNCATQGWGVSTSWRFSGIDTTSLIVCYQVGDYIHMKLHFIQDFTIFSITRSNNYTTCYTCHESLFHKIFF